jgi:hypothetical protein
MTGLLIMGVLMALVGLLASRYGVDSRDGQDWRSRPGSVGGAP